MALVQEAFIFFYSHIRSIEQRESQTAAITQLDFLIKRLLLSIEDACSTLRS